MRNIKLILSLSIFPFVLIGCMCKAHPDIMNIVVHNQSLQNIQIVPFKKGIKDTVDIKTIKPLKSDIVPYFCYFRCDSVEIDSVQVIYNQTIKQTHYGKNIINIKNDSPKLFYNHKRNILNNNNFNQSKIVHDSKKRNCDWYEYSSIYTFTQQDYLDAQN